MRKLKEPDVINRINTSLLAIMKEVHGIIIRGDGSSDYQKFVPVDTDVNSFCEKALADIKTVIPYYFREYIEKKTFNSR